MANSTARMIDILKAKEQSTQSVAEDRRVEPEQDSFEEKAQQPEYQDDNQMQYLLKNCLSPDIPEPEAKR